MEIAFISDIHANLPALKAVLKDIEKYNPDNIFCLGDLVNFAGWDNEVIELIRKNHITCLQGNHDEGIGFNHEFRFSFQTQTQKEFGILSIEKVQHNLSDVNKKFLRTLPFSVLLTFKFSFQTVRLAMVHGSPMSNEDYVTEKIPNDSLLAMLDEINADILLLGHTHKPFHKAISWEEENRKIYKHVINVGSVGKPKHGNNKSCYAILDIDENIQLNNPDSIKVNFEYVDYDVEQVIKKIHDSELGNAYDDFLRNGQN